MAPCFGCWVEPRSTEEGRELSISGRNGANMSVLNPHILSPSTNLREPENQEDKFSPVDVPSPGAISLL